MTTLRDVAREAGVSVQTVSNVVNARPVVQAETRARVEAVLRRLEYRPNSAARGLRRSRAQAIGLLVADPSPRYLADPFHGALLSGLADIARERGYSLLIHSLGPGDEPPRFTDPFRQRLIDGAVVTLGGAAVERTRLLSELRRAGAPIVLLEQQTRLADVAAVVGDNRNGALAATRQLLSRGHRRLVFLAPRVAWPAVEERVAGFREAVHGVRNAQAQVVSCVEESAEAARAETVRILSETGAPSAFFGANDLLALGALEAVSEAGLSCPDQAAVIGFDDFDFARHVRPRLSTVALPGHDMGRAAGQLLVGRIERGRFSSRRVEIPARLVLRESA